LVSGVKAKGVKQGLDICCIDMSFVKIKFLCLNNSVVYFKETSGKWGFLLVLHASGKYVTKRASHRSDLRVVTIPHLEVSGHVDKESYCVCAETQNSVKLLPGREINNCQRRSLESDNYLRP